MKHPFDYKAVTATQLSSWKMAQQNYAALDSVELRTFAVNNTKLNVQFNVERYRSTLAKIDAKSLAERPCFLCANNRPKEQLRHPINENFELLVNPFPIFKHHYTIPSYLHKPQLIEGQIPEMLSISKQLQPLIVFYNGPFSGASAPDHLHFQAFESSKYTENFEEENKSILFQEKDAEVFTLPHQICKSLTIKSADRYKINAIFRRFLKASSIPEGQQEPMMNILCKYENGNYYLKVIPRKKHRPDIFYAAQDQRIRISPACIDLTGLLVIPFEEDFNRITSLILEESYNEVCLTEGDFKQLCEDLTTTRE